VTGWETVGVAGAVRGLGKGSAKGLGMAGAVRGVGKGWARGWGKEQPPVQGLGKEQPQVQGLGRVGLVKGWAMVGSCLVTDWGMGCRVKGLGMPEADLGRVPPTG
jgi:hypothetical protein